MSEPLPERQYPTRGQEGPAYWDGMLRDYIDGGDEYLAGEVTTLTGQVSGIDTAVDGLAAQVGALDTNVDGLTGQVGALDTAVDGLTTSVGGLATDVGALETSVGGLTTDVTALEGKVIFVDDVADIPPGTPVDTLVVVRNGA